MVKLIIHAADIHIRLYKRLPEYEEVLDEFVRECSNAASGYGKEEVRIVIAGDLVHSYNNISNEMISVCSRLINRLSEIGKVIVISGNHDMEEAGSQRKDTISAIFDVSNFGNAVFLDRELGYRSGCYADENIAWVLYSPWDRFSGADTSIVRSENPRKWVIGLYHGMVTGASMQNGTVVDNGISQDVFADMDCAMLGHIHKRQVMERKGVQIVYPGSLIQQDMGETVTQHGFAVWKLDGLSSEDGDIPECEFVDLENRYSTYKFSVTGVEDCDNGTEKLCNW